MATRAGGGRFGERDAPFFYTAMGLFVLLVVFAGFARTYYLADFLPAPERAPPMTAVLHLHAAAFTLWIALMALQPALVSAGQVALHRRIGLAGAGLALFVWLFGNVAAIDAIHHGYRGLGDPYAFYAITFFSIQAFAVFVLLGIARRGDGDSHKRLMLLSNAAILEAAVGRLPLDLVAATAPLSFYVGANLVIAAGIVHDLLVRGRVHPVWIWGGGGLVLSQVLRVAVMDSPWWLAFARAAAGFW
ncbi:MAG: hypothetical protein ACK4K7_02165 [Allosphingosinicella sp.]|uniref:hypothetical protein n=1 Tax=Allosphingosinicella sp. TaxID=2823234 RepID=UPI00393D1BF3